MIKETSVTRNEKQKKKWTVTNRKTRTRILGYKNNSHPT
jgi:hypothetical protein